MASISVAHFSCFLVRSTISSLVLQTCSWRFFSLHQSLRWLISHRQAESLFRDQVRYCSFVSEIGDDYGNLTKWPHSRRCRGSTGKEEADETLWFTCTTCGLPVRKLRIHLHREKCRPRSHSLIASLESICKIEKDSQKSNFYNNWRIFYYIFDTDIYLYVWLEIIMQVVHIPASGLRNKQETLFALHLRQMFIQTQHKLKSINL